MKDGKILLSGVKPTGRPHVANYLGAMKQFVDLQNDYECFFAIVDYHALNFIQNADEMRDLTYNLAVDYLAIGLDPKKNSIFKQSDVAAHTELSWIFSTITSMPYLMRAHAFKDAEAKNKEINVGTFNYPMLMAADILLYDADVVPVGLDQKQHIEIARDVAIKFNRIFGETFKPPQALIMETTQTVPGTDGQKMSKSYKNTIELFASDADVRTAIMKIPTDSKDVSDVKDPLTDKIFALHKFFTDGTELEDLEDRYETGKIGYKESKEILIKNIINFIAPLREKREKIVRDKDYVLGVLKEGRERARERTEEKMSEVKERIGVNLE
jgi:tryptophanyl-tRNA synthetase